MTIPLTADQLEAFTPPSAQDLTPKPVFYLKVPTYAERAQFNRQMHSQCAYRMDDAHRLRELRKAVIETVADDQQAETLAIIARAENVKSTDNDFVEVSAKLDNIATEMETHNKAYALLAANHRFYFELVPIVATQMFCVRADHMELARKNGQLTEASLQTIPAKQVSEIGWEIFSMIYLTPEQRKNLLQLSVSPPDRSSLPAKKKSKKDGLSKAKPTT